MSRRLIERTLQVAGLLAALTLLEPAAAKAQQGPSGACKDAAHHAFDFWIGRWTVTDRATGKPAGNSLIESVYGGCAIRENWSEPLFSGGSLDTYDASTGKWRQTWTDSGNGWHEYVGGPENGNMVLIWRHKSAKDPTKMALERMTFTPNPDGTVRQHKDGSRDEGATWTDLYDYIYHPVSKP